MKHALFTMLVGQKIEIIFMMAKILGRIFMHDPVKVDQFAVVTARHEVGTWSIITLQVEDRIFLILKTLPHTSASQIV